MIKIQISPLALSTLPVQKKPGGGWLNGAQAQEESLARSSTLVASLSSKVCDEFYDPKLNASLLSSGVYSDRVISSPNCLIIRDSQGAFCAPQKCEFLSCAAVNAGVARKTLQEYDIENLMKFRVEAVLAVAVARKLPILILGAWGTGVFKNSEYVIARCFANALRNRFAGYFKKIVFAIPDDPEWFKPNHTLATFEDAFSNVPFTCRRQIEVDTNMMNFDFSEDVIDTLHDHSTLLWASGLIEIVGDDALIFPEQWIGDNRLLAPYLMALVWLSKCPGWKNLKLDDIWNSLLNQTELPYDVFCLASGVYQQLPTKEILAEPEKMIWLLHKQTMWIFKLMPESIFKQARIIASGNPAVWSGRDFLPLAIVRVGHLESIFERILSGLSGQWKMPSDWVCLDIADNGAISSTFS